MFGKTTLRGGQTLLHDVHMWGQLVRWEIIGFVLVVVLFPSIALFSTTTAYDWRIVGMGTLAEIKLSIGYSPDSGQGQMHESIIENQGSILLNRNHLDRNASRHKGLRDSGCHHPLNLSKRICTRLSLSDATDSERSALLHPTDPNAIPAFPGSKEVKPDPPRMLNPLFLKPNFVIVP